MIAITGASGQLGRLVINELLKSLPSTEIIAVVRNPEKVTDLAETGITIRQGDYSKPETLPAAFADTDKLLLISSSEVGQRTPQHANVIEAAKQAQVKLLAYTSLLHADSSPLPLATEHLQTEQLLAESGLPHVILRNGWYTENYTASVGPALQYGVVMGCAKNGQISSAARADYAAAAAKVLLSENQQGKVYELAGDKAYTLDQFARKISQQSGKPVSYQNMSEADFTEALKRAGLPDPLALLLAESDTGASRGGLFDNSHSLSSLIGRSTTSYVDSIRQALV